MEQLIQALTAYTTALEQKLSALEARVAQLEEANEAMRREGDEAKALIATLRAEVTSLSAAGVVATPAEEPEVEIELIVEEDSETENGEVRTENELAEEPQEEPQEEPEPLETLEPLELLDPLEPLEVVTPAPAPQPVQSTDNLAPSDTPSAKPTQPAKGAQPLQTSLFGTAVEDIRQAISLGDRFLFQRELFAGNGELMQKTLDELNALGSLSEAMDYVLDNFEWDKESTAVQLFENVLKRRFG